MAQLTIVIVLYMTRDEFRALAVHSITTHDTILIRAATGSGKSRIAIEMANRVNAKSVLIVVPQQAHKDNWRKELAKWNFNGEAKIICYASMKTKLRDTTYDVVIMDEAHHITADTYSYHARRATYKKVILLSATMTDEQLPVLSSIFGMSVHVMNYTMSTAIKEKALPEPTIYLIPLKLDNKEASCVVKWAGPRKETTRTAKVQCMWEDRFAARKRLSGDMSLYAKCTPQQKYDWLSNTIKDNLNNGRQKVAFMFSIKRKEFLGIQKTKVANIIVNKLRKEKRRFVTFCATLEQADAIGKGHAVHSKMLHNDKTVSNFNKGIIDELFVKNMLNECMNLNNIECGVIVQIDGKEGAFVQKCGRVLRSKRPEIYIPYYEGTQDEIWVMNALRNIDEKYIIKTSLQSLCDI